MFTTIAPILYTNVTTAASLFYDTKFGCLSVSNPVWGVTTVTIPNLYATEPTNDTSNLTDYFTASALRTNWVFANTNATWTFVLTNTMLRIDTTGENVMQLRAIYQQIPNPNSNWVATLTMNADPTFNTDSGTVYYTTGLTTSTNNAGLGKSWQNSVIYWVINTSLRSVGAYIWNTISSPANEATGTGDPTVNLLSYNGKVQLRTVFTAATTNLAYSYSITPPGESPVFRTYYTTTPTNAA